MAARLIKRTRDGRYQFRLGEPERQLLGRLVDELREMLVVDNTTATEPDSVLRRLFPPAYAQDDDREREKEYRALAHDELLEKRLAAIDTVTATLHAEVLEADELDAWMSAINDLRLVLGTRLDVSEDMDVVDPEDPDAPFFGLYALLTHLLAEAVHAAADW